jgi:hypothetical protein
MGNSCKKDHDGRYEVEEMQQREAKTMHQHSPMQLDLGNTSMNRKDLQTNRIGTPDQPTRDIELPQTRGFLTDSPNQSRRDSRLVQSTATAMAMLPKYPISHLTESGPVPPRHIVLRSV